MPQTITYGRHPIAADGPLTVSGAIAISETDATRGAVAFSANRSQSTTFGRAIFTDISAFLRCDFGLISAAVVQGDRLNSATLRLKAESSVGSVLSGMSVALLARDGVWDSLSGVGYTALSGNDCRCVLTLSGGTVTTSVATDISLYPIKNDVQGCSPDRWGQAITISGASGALVSITFRTDSNMASALARVRVYAAAASDGSDYRPAGALLATSNDASILQGTAVITTWNFTGANQITPTSGNAYVFIVETDYSPNSTLFVSARNRRTGDYPLGKMIVGSPTHYAFHETSYGVQRQHPHIYQIDGVTTDAAPFGSRKNWDVPEFTVSGNFYDLDVTQMVQEWVDDPGFVASVIAFQIAASGVTSEQNLRTFNDYQLVLSVVQDQSLSCGLSGVVNGTYGLGLLNGLAGGLEAVVNMAPTLFQDECNWFVAAIPEWFTEGAPEWFSAAAPEWFNMTSGEWFSDGTPEWFTPKDC